MRKHIGRNETLDWAFRHRNQHLRFIQEKELETALNLKKVIELEQIQETV